MTSVMTIRNYSKSPFLQFKDLVRVYFMGPFITTADNMSVVVVASRLLELSTKLNRVIIQVDYHV